MAVTAVAQTRSVPLKNAVLQSDMNAGGFYITNAAGITDANGNPITGGGGGGTTYTFANTNATLSFYTNGSTVLLGTNVVGGTGDISATSSNNLVAGWIAADNTMSNAIMLFVDLTNDYLVAAMDLKTGFSDSTNIATAVLNASDSLFATDNGGYYSINTDKPIAWGMTNSVPLELEALTIGVTNRSLLTTNSFVMTGTGPKGIEFGDDPFLIAAAPYTNGACFSFALPRTQLTNDPFVSASFFMTAPASAAVVFEIGYQLFQPGSTATADRFDVFSIGNVSGLSTNTIQFSGGTGFRYTNFNFTLTGMGAGLPTNGGKFCKVYIGRQGTNAADTATKSCIVNNLRFNYPQ